MATTVPTNSLVLRPHSKLLTQVFRLFESALFGISFAGEHRHPILRPMQLAAELMLLISACVKHSLLCGRRRPAATTDMAAHRCCVVLFCMQIFTIMIRTIQPTYRQQSSTPRRHWHTKDAKQQNRRDGGQSWASGKLILIFFSKYVVYLAY